jgi:Tol biopolymer transport system component
MVRSRLAVGVLLSVAALGLSGCVFIQPSSVSSSEAQADGTSFGPSISGDGRYVAFGSSATNLVADDTNGFTDVFVRDHQTGDTERVSVGSTGGQADGFGHTPSISDDGHFIAYMSEATNLVAGDTNGTSDVFVHDRTTGATARVSVDSAGTQANGGGSGEASISDDGRYVAFLSFATNLVTGDDNAHGDVFVHDRTTGATERVSVDSTGTQANDLSGDPSISDDGRYIAYMSEATNLVAGDTNTNSDVFVHDRRTGRTERVSVDSTGTQGGQVSVGASISGDARYVAFYSFATNLVAGDTNAVADVFVHDRRTRLTERVSVDSAGTQANDVSATPSFSGDGRYVAFDSLATNLVAGDTNGAFDVFVHDRTNGVTQRASLNFGYGQADRQSRSRRSISDDGRYVAFFSEATNLNQNDTNGVSDVFLKFALAPRPLGTTGSTSIPRGTTGQITITGSWLDPTHLQVSANPAAGVTIDTIAVQDPNTSAVLTITVAADAETGSRDLFVTNPGNSWNTGAGGTDVCPDCLTIT